MPITKSAKKSLRTSITKNKRNDKTRKELEIGLKKVSSSTLSKVVSIIDKAAKRGIIHKNKASRLKSRLSKKITSEPGKAKKAAPKPAKKAVAKKTTKSKAK